MTRRIVVTGRGLVTSLGENVKDVLWKLDKGISGIEYRRDWEEYKGLNTRLAGTVKNFKIPGYYSRKKLRGMGRVSQFAVRSAEYALIDSGLLSEGDVFSSKMGIAYGSSSGSPEGIEPFAHLRMFKEMAKVTATSYVMMMPHTCAANIGIFFQLTGRVIPTSSACTSGSQAIGFAFESIKSGKEEIMIAGGAEELDVSMSAVFDALFATSVKNEHPNQTPSPFDAGRDGLVIGEGAGTLILEEYEHAKKRGAPIYAEVVGFGTNSNGTHITQPSVESMKLCIEEALEDAKIPANKIKYVSAHGTATELGDVSEAIATHSVFGHIPTSTLKGHFGHTLGACGSLEGILAIEMMNRGVFTHTLNLKNPDPQCLGLDYIIGSPRKIDTDYVLNNNFAFGGVNTSVIFKKLT